MDTKIYYVANARMPSEKAHGIQIAKMCEAFIENGVELELVVPTRGSTALPVAAFYGLRVEVPLVRIPALDLYNFGRIGYALSSLSFMLGYLGYFCAKRVRGEKFLLYTVDLDNYSSSALALIGMPLFTEMHGGKPDTIAQRFLFKSLRGTIAINSLIVKELQKTFSHSRTKYLVQPNGVDAAHFGVHDQAEARARLSLPRDEKIALYAGRFFAWKGLESLVEAALHAPDISWYLVGGTREYFTHITGIEELPRNMIFKGDQPYADMPYWIAAADALVVLGTVRDQQSYWYTSPMKLFEYLLSERPIVASSTPAIKEIVTDTEVIFYEPDNGQSLAEAVTRAVFYPEESGQRILQACTRGRRYSWKARAEAIVEFITTI